MQIYVFCSVIDVFSNPIVGSFPNFCIYIKPIDRFLIQGSVLSCKLSS